MSSRTTSLSISKKIWQTLNQKIPVPSLLEAYSGVMRKSESKDWLKALNAVCGVPCLKRKLSL